MSATSRSTTSSRRAQGTSAANTGTDSTVGAATLTGNAGWSTAGALGGALDLSGGSNANAVDLPDNLLQGEENFSTSFWVRPDTKANWIGLFHLGDGLEGAGSFFQIQMQTQAAGNTGLAATFKAKGSALQERVYATPTKDVVANQWNHVAFTRQGATGTLYLNGVAVASRDRPHHRHGRRRAHVEQLAGSQRVPRPGVRRAHGRRPPLHVHALRGRRGGPVRRRHRAAHHDDAHGRPGLPVAVRGAGGLHGHRRG